MPKYLAIVIIVFATITVGDSAFTRIPRNLTVPVGSSAVAPFFCQHLLADDIFWRVNGNLLHQLNDPDVTACSVTLPNGQRIYKLKILAKPEYNDSSIVCVAVFFGQATNVIESVPAKLTIIDGARSLPNGFIDTPDSLIAAFGERAIFDCRHCATLEINWQLNGTVVPTVNLPENIYVNYSFPDNPSSLACGGVYSLIFADITTYNETTIQCEANINDAPNEASDSALLLTQGQLGHVTNLRRNFTGNLESVVYEWEPPFSLNVTNVEPDIAYCVHIYNVTCPTQKRITVSESCMITEPLFSLTKNFDEEEILEIEVIARTNLDVAQNGTDSATYRDTLVSFNHTLVEYNVTVVTSKHVDVLVGLYLQGIDPSSDTVLPDEIEVQLIDVYSNNSQSMTCPTVLIGATMSFAHFNLNCSEPLGIRKLFLSTIFIPTPGCKLNSSSEIELSTHLIQNVQVFSLSHDHDQPNGILVSGDLLNADIANITALGFLAIAYSNSDPQSPYYGIAIPLSDDNTLHAEVLLHTKSSIEHHQYRVSVFGIEDHGLPFSESAHLAQPALAVSASSSTADNIILIHTNSSNSTPNVHALYRNGCIQCTFLDDSASSCVVITSDKSQTNSSRGVTNIEVFNITRKGERGYRCINKTISDFNIIVFTFDKTLSSISGPGVRVCAEHQPPITNTIFSTPTGEPITNNSSISRNPVNIDNNMIPVPALSAIGVVIVIIIVIVSVLIIMIIYKVRTHIKHFFSNKTYYKGKFNIHHEESDTNLVKESMISATSAELSPQTSAAAQCTNTNGTKDWESEESSDHGYHSSPCIDNNNTENDTTL